MESSFTASETMPDGRLRSSRGSTHSRWPAGRRGARRIGVTDRDLRELRKQGSHMVVSFASVVCGRMTTALSARRPSAGAVPGRRGACLAVRTPPAALLVLLFPFPLQLLQQLAKVFAG